MFCYQPEIADGQKVTPGLQNSATELMTPEKFWQLVTSPQTAWLVAKHREVKDSLVDPKWTYDRDFLEYDAMMSSWKKNTREGKAYAACDTDAKRVAMWCDSLKKRLPYVIFIATYLKRAKKEGEEPKMWRSQKHAQLNGLVVIDFDHVEGDVVERWREAYEGLSEADRERILFVFVSPGGHGLKVVFKATLEGNLIDNQMLFARKLGMTVDESCKDAARGTFLTTKEDIIYINEKELFTYEDKVFAEKWSGQYRRGNSQPTMQTPPDLPCLGEGLDSPPKQEEVEGVLSYGGWSGSLQDLLSAYYGDRQPGPEEQGGNGMSRHTESLKWATDLLVMTGRNKERTERLLRSIPWVDAIVKERGEPVDQTVKDADERVREREKKYGANIKPSKAMQTALDKLTKCTAEPTPSCTLPLDEWGREIESMFDTFPCLREVCGGQRVGVYPAVLFTSAAFFGTLMTRCTWHHWFEPDKVRRLNYSVIIIGPPTSGKNFASSLHELLAAPIKAADKVATDAINKWKEDKGAKADNKEKPKKPVVIIRNHPARTANGVFITDMVNAVEVVDGEPMNLHMLTFDSELDNATLMAKGGQWIDKAAMELKAFHNEEDGQAYGNLDSYTGTFRVYWNFVYTGTPLSLDRKVNERNFGTGLATRLAVIPMPGRNYKLAEYGERRNVDHAANELLKTWAYRLDGVRGELPIEPLVRATYDWQSAKMEIAAYDDDEAMDMLLMRVPYYGIGIAAPYVLMRHWDEWQQQKTLTLDEQDVRLCRLAMDIQYACQQHFFYAYAKAYFDNMKRDRKVKQRERNSKYDERYKLLPQEFTVEELGQAYGIGKEAMYAAVKRLCDDGYIERLKRGNYRKIKQTIQL